MFLEMDSQVFLILGLCIIIPIFILLIVAFTIKIVKSIKVAKGYKKSQGVGESLHGDVNEFKNLLLQVFNEGNILNVKREMSRITIVVKDIDLVNADGLKECGATGVLLVGNMVKCSFGDRSEAISKILLEVCNE